MANRLQLCIAEDHFRLNLLLPRSHNSWKLRCRRWLAYLNGDDSAFYSVKTSVAAPVRASSLAETLDQLLNAVQRNSHMALQGATLNVEVGGSDSRVGLFEIDGVRSARVTPEELSMYANTWVKHTWSLSPDDYIVRCTQTPKSSTYVVTAVRKSLVHVLEDACKRQKLRFVDCKPALIAQLTKLSKPTSNSVVICNERQLDGSCSPRAYLLGVDAVGLVSISSVWCPENPDMFKQEALNSWLQRVIAQHRWLPPIQTSTFTWPIALDTAEKRYEQ